MGASEGSSWRPLVWRMTDAPAAPGAPGAVLVPRRPTTRWRRGIERFRAAIAGRAPVRRRRRRSTPTSRCGPVADGGLVLHRAYWSAAGRRGPTASARPRSSYHADARPRDVAGVPRGPRAARARAAARRRARPALHAAAALHAAPEAGGRAAIVKVKRPHRAAEAWGLLGAVHRALGRRPRRLRRRRARSRTTPARATYAQTAAPGRRTSPGSSTPTRPGLLRRAGALHRAMHAADVPGIPAEDPAGALARAARRRALGRVRAARARGRGRARSSPCSSATPSSRRAAPAFCHGDLVPSQLLVDGDALGDHRLRRRPHRRSAPRPRDLARRAHLRRPRARPPPTAATRRDRRAEAAYLDGYGAARRAPPALAPRRGRGPLRRGRAQEGPPRPGPRRRAACGSRARARRRSTMSEPPRRRPRPQLDRASAACREVAWQLLRRLPADRFDLRVVRPAPRRRARRTRARAPASRASRTHGVPVSFADASGSLGVVAHLCDWLVAERRRPRPHPLLPAEPPGPPGRACPLREPADCGSSPTTTTPTTTSGQRRGRSRSSAACAAATDRVVACSAGGRRPRPRALGVAPERLTVVPNGVETARFAGGDRAAARAALGIADDRPVVALVGRIERAEGPGRSRPRRPARPRGAPGRGVPPRRLDRQGRGRRADPRPRSPRRGSRRRCASPATSTTCPASTRRSTCSPRRRAGRASGSCSSRRWPPACRSSRPRSARSPRSSATARRCSSRPHDPRRSPTRSTASSTTARGGGHGRGRARAGAGLLVGALGRAPAGRVRRGAGGAP